jgi:hypothetical protein
MSVSDYRLEAKVRIIALVSCFIAFAVPSHAAQQQDAASLAKKCREMMGKEAPEGEGRSHIGHFQVQRFSDCMMDVH